VIGAMRSSDSILQLLLACEGAAAAAARRIVAVVPYLGYARQDRRVGGRPRGAVLMARLIEAAGVQAVVLLDPNNPATEGFFRIPVLTLSPVKPCLANRPARPIALAGGEYRAASGPGNEAPPLREFLAQWIGTSVFFQEGKVE
jgi:phosphoribosylpyrophosphate synthetase